MKDKLMLFSKIMYILVIIGTLTNFYLVSNGASKQLINTEMKITLVMLFTAGLTHIISKYTDDNHQ